MTIKKITLITLAAVLLFTAGCVTTPRRGTTIRSLSSQAIKIGGADYVSAALIANYYRMNSEWDPIARKLTLIKDDTSFTFHVGMNYVIINDKLERMANAAGFYQGNVVVPLDFVKGRMVETFGLPRTAAPPARPTQRYTITKIVIDPGHGGGDPGAISSHGVKEKDVVLDISKRLKKELTARGIEVVMTRDRDKFVSLNRRTQLANNSGADFFVSIHSNAARAKGVNGFEVYYLSNAIDDNARAIEAAENSSLKVEESSFYYKNTALEATLWDLVYTENREESIELARNITEAVDHSTSFKNRGIKSARFYVLKGTQIPSVLVEVGFISNSSDEKKLTSPSYKQAIACAIAKGILNYKRFYESTDGFTR